MTAECDHDRARRAPELTEANTLAHLLSLVVGFARFGGRRSCLRLQRQSVTRRVTGGAPHRKAAGPAATRGRARTDAWSALAELGQQPQDLEVQPHEGDEQPRARRTTPCAWAGPAWRPSR